MPVLPPTTERFGFDHFGMPLEQLHGLQLSALDADTSSEAMRWQLSMANPRLLPAPPVMHPQQPAQQRQQQQQDQQHGERSITLSTAIRRGELPVQLGKGRVGATHWVGGCVDACGWEWVCGCVFRL